MAKKASKGTHGGTASCCGDGCCDSNCSCRATSRLDCCKVEGVVRVDGRGQMVLPKDLRAKAGIGPNDKLAVLSWTQDERLCCITLQRADELAELVRKTYGPLLSTAIRTR